MGRNIKISKSIILFLLLSFTVYGQEVTGSHLTISGNGRVMGSLYTPNLMTSQLTLLGYQSTPVDVGTAISQANGLISLTAASVSGGTVWQLQDTVWTALWTAWGTYGPGIGYDVYKLVDSVKVLRSGITVADSLINVYATQITTVGDRVTTDSSRISVNANSISLVSTRLTNDSSNTWSSIALLSNGHININGYTTFSSGYNPTTKIPYSDTSNTANHINYNTTTINGNKLTAGTVTADYVVANISITSPTITGGTLQTNTTGQRVVIDNSNQIKFYNSSNTFAGSIYGSGQLTISAFQTGGSNGYLSVNNSGVLTLYNNITLSSISTDGSSISFGTNTGVGGSSTYDGYLERLSSTLLQTNYTFNALGGFQVNGHALNTTDLVNGAGFLTSSSSISLSQLPTITYNYGGTGLTTTSNGGVITGNLSSNGYQWVAGNSSTTNKYLMSMGDGTTPALPTFHQVDFSDLSGAVTTSQTNLSTTTAPSTTAADLTTANVYGTGGSGTTVLAIPTTWLQIKVGSTTYKVPAY